MIGAGFNNKDLLLILGITIQNTKITIPLNLDILLSKIINNPIKIIFFGTLLLSISFLSKKQIKVNQ